MAATIAEFNISPVYGGSALASGLVSPITVVPTKVKLSITATGQVAPAAEYTLTNVVKSLYTTTINELLAGYYYWFCEDENQQVIASGYILLEDTTNTYRAGKTYSGEVSAEEIMYTLRANAKLSQGERAKHVMDEWTAGSPPALTEGRDTVEGLEKV